ncbi:putative lipoprotein [Leptospira johnsonii]|uniref:Putative lipoprotein n=2 Tax=Leptospira johnsonii TaxID=1917820 RepID=A0A2P2D4V0_9LEPT|nr:putative lipoprotein [Leptospira johnsonii]
MQKVYTDHPDINKACLQFLSSEKSDPGGNERIMLDTLYKISEQDIRENYLTGQIVYVPEAGEGKHFHLTKDGKLEYYRIKYETLSAKEGTEFFCAERYRLDLEKKFQATSAKLKTNPLDLKARQELETNLDSYLKFANSVHGKSQIVRNFLFFSLGKYMKGDQGIPVSPCEFTQKILNPITIATSGLTDADSKLAWAANIQIFTAYELGFTMAGYCK